MARVLAIHLGMISEESVGRANVKKKCIGPKLSRTTKKLQVSRLKIARAGLRRADMRYAQPRLISSSLDLELA